MMFYLSSRARVCVCVRARACLLCAVVEDCTFSSCNPVKRCGGYSGKSPEEPGDTCKAIKQDYPDARNGKYWIRGVNQVLTHSVLAYCWMEGTNKLT